MHDLVWRKAVRQALSAVPVDVVNVKEEGAGFEVTFRRYRRPDKPGENDATFLTEMVTETLRINVDGELFKATARGFANWKGNGAWFASFKVVRR